MDANAATEMKGNLKLVIQQARNATLKNEEGFADRVAHCIVNHIAGLIQELLSKHDDDASKSIRHLEKEIDDLSSSLNSFGHGGIVELIQNRDMQKVATEKASRVVNIAMSFLPANGEANGELTSVQVTHASSRKDEVLLSLVGQDGLEKMKENKRAHEEVRQKMKAVEARTSPEYQALELNLCTFQAEHSLVEEKILELKKSLKRLEEEEAMLNRRIHETQTEIAGLHEASNGEIAKLQKELAQTSKAVESDVSVRTLADRMASCEAFVKDSMNGSTLVGIAEEEEVSKLIPGKIGLYLIRARNYFRSEADCVQFLRSRVRTLETEANTLVSCLSRQRNCALVIISNILLFRLLAAEERTRRVHVVRIDYQCTPSFSFP